MNARGILTAAYQVLLGGTPYQGTPPARSDRGVPEVRSPLSWGTPPQPGVCQDVRVSVRVPSGYPPLGYPPLDLARGAAQCGVPPSQGTPHLDLAWIPPARTWLRYPTSPGVDRQTDGQTHIKT